jgi:hypothetical protein
VCKSGALSAPSKLPGNLAAAVEFAGSCAWLHLPTDIRANLPIGDVSAEACAVATFADSTRHGEVDEGAMNDGSMREIEKQTFHVLIACVSAAAALGFAVGTLLMLALS